MDVSPEMIRLGLVWYVVFLFSTTLHEASHAWAALRLGDPTAYHGGQVTLNPLPHIRREPFGMVLVPILTFVLSGWAIGWASAPYDPQWAMRYPRRAAWMALAGPVSNLALVILAGVVIRAGILAGALAPPDRVGFSHIVASAEPGAWEIAATVLSILFALNLLLFVFNMLPLPPLDGSGVLPLFLSEGGARRWQMFVRQPMMALLGILIAWRIFGTLFWPVLGFALKLLYPGVAYS